MKDVFDSFVAAAQKQKLVRETFTPKVQPFFPLFSSHATVSTSNTMSTGAFGLFEVNGGQFLPVPPPQWPSRDPLHNEDDAEAPLSQHITPLVAQAESTCALTAYESVLSMAKLSASGK